MKRLPCLIFICITALIVGYFSMVSDTLPSHDENNYAILIRFIAELLNDTVTWLIFAMLVGYFFARSSKQAALIGCILAISTMLAYLLFGLLLPQMQSEGSPPPSTAADEAVALAQWFGFAALGGAVGGITGYIARKHPVALLLLVLFILARVITRGSHTWQNLASAGNNVVFLILAICVLLYVVKTTIPRHSQPHKS